MNNRERLVRFMAEAIARWLNDPDILERVAREDKDPVVRELCRKRAHKLRQLAEKKQERAA